MQKIRKINGEKMKQMYFHHILFIVTTIPFNYNWDKPSMTELVTYRVTTLEMLPQLTIIWSKVSPC